MKWVQLVVVSGGVTAPPVSDALGLDHQQVFGKLASMLSCQVVAKAPHSKYI